MDYTIYTTKKNAGLTSITNLDGIYTLTYLKFDEMTGEKVFDCSGEVAVTDIQTILDQSTAQMTAITSNLQTLISDLA